MIFDDKTKRKFMEEKIKRGMVHSVYGTDDQ